MLHTKTVRGYVGGFGCEMGGLNKLSGHGGMTSVEMPCNSSPFAIAANPAFTTKTYFVVGLTFGESIVASQ